MAIHGIAGEPIADIKFIAAVCPRCGGNLNLPDDLKKAHCMYCGAEILVAQAGGVHQVECKACDGFGRVDICPVCDGRGRCTWSTSFTGGRDDLGMLGYSTHCVKGTCSACGGTGRYALAGCPGCGGTGKCPRCYGTGKCPACHGVGLLPNQSGADKCVVCGGTGKVSADADNLPTTGRCPDCKRLWREGQSVCWNCGFKLNKCPKCGAVWATGSLHCRKCGF